MESAATKVFFSFINKLVDVLPIIVICGNHDFKQEDPSITDSIDMFVEPYIGKQLYYLKHTGHYIYNNVGFGVVSVKDTLRRFNTAGIVDDLPAFPAPSELHDVDIKVALFHGTVSASKLANGRHINTKTYPLDWFDGYNIILLGDNHKQQMHTYNSSVWGYPGSLIQQDFGESLQGHGYILWDVETKQGSMHSINNDYGSITIDNDTIVVGHKRRLTVSQAVADPAFPKKPRTRFIGNKNDANAILEELKVQGIIPYSIKYQARYTCSGEEDSASMNATALANLNSPETWEKYMRDVSPNLDVAAFVHHPESLTLPDILNDILKDVPALRDTVLKRNTVIQSLLEQYKNAANAKSAGQYSIKLKNIQWSYLMCYGPNNYFDFDTVDGYIALINGPNASGKSSFLDVVCVALYGEPTVSRREFSGKSMTAKIINDQKPSHEVSGCILKFSIDNTLYEIQRTFTYQNDASLLREKHCVVYNINSTEPVVVAEGTTKVDAWVHERFGSIEETLMSSVLCQNDLTNFFYKKSSDQMKILEKALNMNSITAFVSVLDESVKAHKYILDKLSVYSQGLTDALPEDTITKDQLADMEVQVAELHTQVMHTQQQCNAILATTGGDTTLEPLEDDYPSQLVKYENELASMNEVTPENIENIKRTAYSLESEYNALLQDPIGKGGDIDKDIDGIEEAIAVNNLCKPVKPHFSLEYIITREEAYTQWVSKQPTEWLRRPKKTMKLYQDTKVALYNLEGYAQYFDDSLPRVDVHTDQPLSDLITDLINKRKAYRSCHAIGDATHIQWFNKQPDEFKQDPKNVATLQKKTQDKLDATVHQLETLQENSVAKPHGPKPVVSVILTPKDSIDKLTHILDSIILVPPRKPIKMIAEWDIKWAEWCTFSERVSETPYTDLTARRDNLKTYIAKIQTKKIELARVQDQYASVETELGDINKIEFNPQCWACCKQPKWLRRQELLDKSDILKKQVSKLAKYNIDILEYISELAELEHQIPDRQRYEQMLDFMTYESEEWELAKEEHQKFIADTTRSEELRAKILALEWKQYTQYTSNVMELKTKRDTLQKRLAQLVDFTANYAYYTGYIAQTEYIHAHAAALSVYNNDISRVKGEYTALQQYTQDAKQWEQELNRLSIDRTCAEQWQAWEDNSRHLELCRQQSEWANKVEHCKQRIQRHATSVCMLETYTDITNNIKRIQRGIALVEYHNILPKLQTVLTDWNEASAKLASMSRVYIKQQESRSAKVLNAALETIVNRLAQLQQFHTYFVGDKTIQGFKSWVYQSQVIPLIQTEVNKFISGIDDFELGITLRNSSLVFTLKDRKSNPTLDHASGYQKFIVGLAMRLTLGRIGAVGQNIKHLFIDEGFVACDAVNIHKTNDIIRQIKDLGKYASIIMTSHNDVIRDIADLRVNIQRDTSTNCSRITYGAVFTPTRKATKKQRM